MIDPYPEHTRQREVLNDAEIIGAFLDSIPYVLAEWGDDGYGHLWPVTKSIQRILADYFGIDLAKRHVGRPTHDGG
jgi:hypothetical protein